MFRPRHNAIRVAMLFVMVAATVVSAARVLHAHSEGQQPHQLGTECESSLSHAATPMVWHAHVHLCGLDIHIPVGDEDDLDPAHLPGDLSPSWSSQPTVVDAQVVEVPALEQAFDQFLLPTVSPPTVAFCPPASERNSSITPGRLQRLLLGSLTL